MAHASIRTQRDSHHIAAFEPSREAPDETELMATLEAYHAKANALDRVLERNTLIFEEVMRNLPAEACREGSPSAQEGFRSHLKAAGYDDEACDDATVTCYAAQERALAIPARTIQGLAAKLEAIVRGNPQASRALHDIEVSEVGLSREEWMALVGDIRRLAETSGLDEPDLGS